MKISAQNNDLTFEKKNSGEFYSKISFLRYELFFSFKESIFTSQKEEIDWKLIASFVEHVLKNIESINSRGGKIIEELKKIVHVDDSFYKKEKGNFVADAIELMDFQKTIDYDKSNNKLIQYRFKYDVSFFFENEDDYSLAEYNYIVKFSNHHSLTIIGVCNDIWSLYK